jgi:predicted Rossmann fold nucleotide-binding protein DprA/Smf involved in DNA uptake
VKEIQSILKLVADGLKTIAQSVEAISEKVNQLAESHTAEEPKAAAKPKAKKSLSAATKKETVKKTARKTPKKKAAKAPTAAETVYNVISKSTKGVNTANLMKETGYDRKKVANMVYKLGKQGRIKRVEKGVYVKV